MRFVISRFVISAISGAALAASMTGGAAAQPASDKMPFDIPYAMPVGIEKARQIIAAAVAEAKKHDWKMNVAVVDNNGELIAFERMDGAQIASVNISQGKARTAARFRRPSEVFFKAYESGHPYVATLDPTLVASPGGFPLIEGGKMVGAVGCSGGTGDQDATTCKAGADTVK